MVIDELPDSGRDPMVATRATPGIADSSARRRSRYGATWLAGRPACHGFTDAYRMRVRSKPRSVSRSVASDRPSRPAATSTVRHNAI